MADSIFVLPCLQAMTTSIPENTLATGNIVSSPRALPACPRAVKLFVPQAVKLFVPQEGGGGMR
eukprot:364092-Chlamydomonas_euryale.AAC.1